MPPYVATDAEAYERSMGRWSRPLAERMLEACPRLPRGARVLDAGCGTGALAGAVLARDPAVRLLGLDLSPAYAAAARDALPGARFAVADLARLPLPDEAGLDAALSHLVLAFVPDPVAVTRELARVVRAGGLVAASMWDFRGGLPFLSLLADLAAAMTREGREWRDRHWASGIGQPGGLAAVLREAGLAFVKEQDIYIRQDFTGFEDWWGPWRSGQGIAGAFLVQLPAAARMRLEQAARRAWLAGAAEDGPRSFVATARLAMGIRA